MIHSTYLHEVNEGLEEGNGFSVVTLCEGKEPGVEGMKSFSKGIVVLEALISNVLHWLHHHYFFFFKSEDFRVLSTRM